MTTKIRRWGNSLAIRLPKEIISAIKLEEGSSVYFEEDGDSINIRRIKKTTLDDILRDLEKQKIEKLINFGNDVGREVVE